MHLLHICSVFAEKKMKTDSESKETQKEEQKCKTTFMQIIYQIFGNEQFLKKETGDVFLGISTLYINAVQRLLILCLREGKI